jgi:hypothetical protein
LRFCQVSVNGFQLNFSVGSTAGVTGIARLDEPARDRDRDRERAGELGPVRLHRDDRAAGDRAEQDRDERAHLDQAVAADELLGLSVCGRIAYLTGPNSVECTPISASAAKSRTRSRSQNPANPTTMIAISNSLIQRISDDFSSLSASWPPVATAA